MATAPLTDSGLKKKIQDTEKQILKGEKTTANIADGGGLTLQRQPSGTWTWFYRYRFGAKASRLSLGAYPNVTLAQAREAHRQAKELLTQGIDPSQERKEAKLIQAHAVENNFKAAALAWWNHWRIGRNEQYAKQTLRRLEANVLPLLGTRSMESITTPMLVLMVKDIAKRGAYDMAKRALETSGQIFRYAVQHGICTNNPAASLKPSDVIPKRKVQNQTRIPLKDLPQLLRDIDAYDGHVLTRTAIQLIALTFVRTKELIEAQWSEIDFMANLWRIPAERMKMDTPHIVPLSRQAMALLLELRKITGASPYLFPNQGGRGGNPCMSNNTVLFALYRMGYKSRMTGHGFRGVASTALNEQQYSKVHIELQLAHLAGNATERAYNHAQHMPERIKMMQAWADFLDEQRGGGKVIKMVKG
ncbi:MAG: tyrosine-type recombinase/integrase [Formosimonas sp.]